VTSAADWSSLIELAKTQFGGLDILVNNAGTSYRNKPTLDVTEADYDRCFDVNVRSIYLSMRVVLPHFIERGGGAVINIASIGALRPRPGLVWYNASKAAVVNVSGHSIMHRTD
jgi:NAD(P)-dependent dehydrogenase (short-subunit alcohol dehydrogenase family)